MDDWWNDRLNLIVLIEWLDPSQVSDALHILEKPWNYTAEYECARSVLNHVIDRTEVRTTRSGRPEVVEHKVIEAEDTDGAAAKCLTCGWVFQLDESGESS